MILALCLALSQQTPSPPPATPPTATTTTTTTAPWPVSWVDGPPAPPSAQPLPPSLAPRDGDGEGGAAPAEVLVVPPAPPEDVRVVVDDGLLAPLDDLRGHSALTRAQLVRQPALDLDTTLDRALVPGLVWLPQSAGRAQPSWRGYGAADVAFVVDGVPLIDGAFTEELGLLAPASLDVHGGPRAATPLAARGGVIDVDTGGALDDVGDTGRVDGVFGVGYGGADNEKGVLALGRSGWRRLRVVGHTTLVQREAFRTGRTGLGAAGVVVDEGSVVVKNSGGVGGNVGARVDVVPFDASRLFLSWQAGRSLDAGDPLGCDAEDGEGRPLDCTRARERGADVVVGGFDARRSFFGLDLQPGLRIHAQRSVDDEERSGAALAVVDRGVDNVIRGGASAFVRGRAGDDDFIGGEFFVGVDVVADRYDSLFSSRSLLRSDAEPAAGIFDPLRASFVDDATVRAGGVRGGVVVESAYVDVSAGARVASQFVDTPAGARRDLHTAEVAPAVDVAAVVHASDGVDVRAAVGHVAAPTDARLALGLRVPTDVAAPGAAAPALRTDDFVEAGVVVVGAAVDVDATVWGSYRSGDERLAGLEASLRLKPGLDGLDARLVASGYAKNVGDDAGAGVLQPQAGLLVRYAPSTMPAGFYLRVAGALPQSRLSDDEERDAALCPERPDDATVLQETPCSGAPGFAVVDVGAYLALGQLRFDAVGENLTDTQGAWRGAALGTGGQAVRLRVAFLF